MITILKNISIVQSNKIDHNKTLFIKDGIIDHISGKLSAEQTGELFDCSGLTAIPGFIDTHVHGGNYYDCNDSSINSLMEMGKFYLNKGVTSYYPSLSVDPEPVLKNSFENIRQMMKNPQENTSEILGCHFESPFISRKYKGCQAEERILELNEQTFPLIRENQDIIRRITLAPENGHALDMIKEIKQMNIIISAGHSDCSALLLRESAERGVTMITHLFNAMASVKKEGPFRKSMFLEEALTNDTLFCEIIADGYHVTTEQFQIAFRCKGPEKLMICSDANRGAGCNSGETIYTCGQEVIIENGIAMLKDRSSLASSVTPMNIMFKNLINKYKISIIDAVKMSSSTPAAMMNIQQKKGHIKPGYDADILIINDELDIIHILKKGKFVK